ncbi:MAG: chemotaxis protein CheC [Methanosarcina sp.]
MTKPRILSKYESEALKEIGNIGIGNCATSLSKFVNCFVHTRIIGAGFELIENVPKITGSSEFPVFGAFMQIREALNGYILILFPEESAKILCQNLSDKEENRDLKDRVDLFIIEDICHILGETYTNSLSKFLTLDLSTSTAYTTYDLSDSILNSILAEMSTSMDFALILDAEFIIKEKKISGNILALLDPVSLDYLLKRINEMANQKTSFTDGKE